MILRQDVNRYEWLETQPALDLIATLRRCDDDGANRPAKPGGQALDFDGSRLITRALAHLHWLSSGLPERKGEFCVSTVCGCTGRLHGSSRVGPIAADAADGADGMFRRSAYPDHSRSGSAFTTERNVDP